MTTIVREQFEYRVLQCHAERGMLARVVENVADKVLTILAKPDIDKERMQATFVRSSVSVESSPWFGHWWAKLLRRYDSWMRRTLPYRLERILRLPHWLTELIWAKSIQYSCNRERLPDDVLERIQVMRSYLMRQGHTPTKVIMGDKALRQLRQGLAGYNAYSPEIFFTIEDSTRHIFGLPIQINPFIGEDEVLVV